MNRYNKAIAKRFVGYPLLAVEPNKLWKGYSFIHFISDSEEGLVGIYDGKHAMVCGQNQVFKHLDLPSRIKAWQQTGKQERRPIIKERKHEPIQTRVSRSRRRIHSE